MITRILYENIGPHRRLELKAGAITRINGPNGCGKSSLINGIKWMCDGGKDESLMRAGASDCQMTVEFDDGTTFRKRQWIDDSGKHRYELTGIGASGESLKAPKEKLEALINPLCASPDEFVRATPKKRIEMLLSMVKINFSPDEMKEIFARDSDARVNARQPTSLADFDSLLAGVEERRRESSRYQRDIDGMIAVQREALPNESCADWSGELSSRQKLASDFERQIESARQRRDAKIQHASRDVDAAVAAQIAELQRQIEVARKMASDEKLAISRQAHEEYAAETEGAEEKMAAMYAAVQEANAQARAQQKAAGVKEAIAKAEAARQEHTSREFRLTQVIEGARKARAAKVTEIGVDGLSIDGTDIKINGIDFDHVNTAAQRAIAWDLMIRQMGRSPLVLFDDGNDFDEENRRGFEAECARRGIQLFIAAPITRTEDGESIEDLSVTT